VREVSCRAVEPFLRAADRQQIAAARLVERVGYDLTHLTNSHEYIEWDAFRKFMQNAHAFWDDEALRRIGAQGLTEGVGVRAFALIGRTLASPGGFYRWLLSSGGMGNRLFSNMIPTFRELGSGHFTLSLMLAPGYEPCPPFFQFAAGGFAAIPKLVGLSAARVTVTDVERGALFDIRFEERSTVRGRIMRRLTRGGNARATAAELDNTLRVLEVRYAELTATRNAVEQQNALLDAAYRFGQRIWSERQPAEAAQAVVAALVELAGFAGARLAVAPSGQPEAVTHATAGGGATERHIDLPGQGRLVGTLDLGPRATGDAAQTQTLLDLLVPTIALALDSAFAARALDAYQKTLEAQVLGRTAELRTALDKLASTVRALEDARDARERIFANISHEIRTPLTLILLTIGELEASGAGRAPAAATIEASARKLLRLVDELLLLAAGQAQGLNLRVEPLDVSALITALAAAWRPAAATAGLRLTIDAAPACTAIADPTAIDRIVANLVSNAIKFTPAGGTIALTVAHVGAAIAITVRDDGRGIDDDLLSRLFGRFEQARGPGAPRGGSGIGLSLVKELALAHGGDVTVARLAPGTAFTVTVPASAEPAAAARTPALRPSDFGIAMPALRSGDVLGATDERNTTTILIAEDDPALAGSIARVVGADHRVVIALDGAAALELAARHQPHLLITDVEMPGLDGIELTRRFRALPGNGLAPVIMLSARADLRDRITGLDAGAIDYVVKPFEPGELRARIHAQLEMRALALRLHRTEKLAALGSLSAGLAHELRNPANGIVNAIAPLRELLPPELARGDAPTAQLLDVLAGCAEQIGFLSKQLLGFRRGGDLELRTAALPDVIERAITLLRPSLKGIDLRQHHAALPPIRCAAPLLVQVITNLIENGVHAAGPGGWVEVSSHTTEDAIVIEVTDSGPGVPLELRERIFEPFFTTKPPGAGTGLGLAVARDIVQRHGGTLEVRARADRSLFAIELPQRAAPEPS
jgi:signal transduction histidine kinase